MLFKPKWLFVNSDSLILFHFYFFSFMRFNVVVLLADSGCCIIVLCEVKPKWGVH